MNVLLLKLAKIQSQINQLQKDFLGKSNERLLVSELTMLAQKWSKIAAQKKVDLWVFATY